MNDRPPAIDRQTARGMIIALKAFKGHELEEYSFLIDPFVEFICKTRCLDLEGLSNLAEAFLSVRSMTTPTEVEPSVTAELLADQIKPWVEDIRQKLFHSKSAPFRSVSDAKKWLDEVGKKLDEWHKRADEWSKKVDEWHKRVDERNKRIDEFRKCWQAILEKYPHITGGVEKWLEMKKQGIEVEFPTEDEEQELAELQRAVQSLEIGKVGKPPELDEDLKIYDALLDSMFEIDKVTGFTWESLKMYILADASPILPPFTFGIVKETRSLPSGVNLQNRFARVDIRGELNFQDLRSLYQSIRRELAIKRLKRPKEKHLQLYKMVKKRGSIPNREGTVAFWKSVMEEWNDVHPQDPYKTWKGVKLAYERIITQIERRMTKEGDTK